MPIVIQEVTYFTVQESATYLDVSESRVLQFIHEGRLNAVKIGRPWYVNRLDLIAFKKVPRHTGNLTGMPRIKKIKTPA